jgi:hypothetical protein
MNTGIIARVNFKKLAKTALLAAGVLVVFSAMAMIALPALVLYFFTRDYVTTLVDADFQEAKKWGGTLILPEDATHISARHFTSGLQTSFLFYRFTIDPARIPAVIESLKKTDSNEKQHVIYSQYQVNSPGESVHLSHGGEAPSWWHPETITQGIVAEPNRGSWCMHIAADTASGTVYVYATD